MELALNLQHVCFHAGLWVYTLCALAVLMTCYQCWWIIYQFTNVLMILLTDLLISLLHLSLIYFSTSVSPLLLSIIPSSLFNRLWPGALHHLRVQSEGLEQLRTRLQSCYNSDHQWRQTMGGGTTSLASSRWKRWHHPGALAGTCQT